MLWLVFTILLGSSCLYALFYGEQPERRVALMLLAAAVATPLVGFGLPQPKGSIRWPVMLVDFALAGGLIWIALTADRLWPLVVAALQLITAVGHPALEIAGKASQTAYLTIIFMSGFLIPPVLAFGTFLHRRRAAPMSR